MTPSIERLIALEGAYNIRDLGGYPIAGGGETRWRRLLRGDGLHRLTSADRDLLMSQGLAAVIDLRNAAEAAGEVNPFATDARVRYTNLSLFAALAPLDLVARDGKKADLGRRYCEALDGCGPAIAAVLSAIAAAPEDGAVLFHCSAGKDRTGVIAALLLAHAAVDEETIIADYALTATLATTLIADLRARALSRGLPAAAVETMLASVPESMRVMLGHLKAAHGGVTRYFEAIGIDRALQARLRGRLV